MSAANGRNCGEDVAAYVLGALEPGEAEAFRRHIADCAACRDEVAAFERVTETLPTASAQYEVPRALRRRVMREVRASPEAASPERPRRVRAANRFPLAWGAGLATLLVAAIVVVALSTGGSGGTRTIQASVGSAELRVTGDHGYLVVHRLPAPPTGRIYEMWITRVNAAPSPTGTLFSTTSGGTAAVGVPGSLDGVSAVMVTQERAGGTLAPTSAPVIVARVS